MSSILDALKKSDLQRSEHAAASPYLHTGTAGSSARRRRWRLPLVLILLAVTALVWWWLSPDSLTHPEVATPKVTGSGNETAATANIQASSEGKLEPEPDPATLTPVPNRAQSQPVIEPVVEPAPEMAGDGRVAELPAREAALDEPGFEPPTVRNDVPALTPENDPFERPATEPPAETPVTPSPAPVPASESLIQLSQLGAEDRGALSALKISIVVFDPDPTRAFAIVDGSRKQVGDSVLDGVRLHAITREGLVLDVDGQQVLMTTR